MSTVILRDPDSRHGVVLATLMELLDIPDKVTWFEVRWDGENGLRVACEYTPPKVFEPEEGLPAGEMIDASTIDGPAFVRRGP